MVIVLMGVAGSGKTTIGRLLASRLGWPFRDADDFHPALNREKMRHGLPLDDNDRQPWLEAIRASIARSINSNQNVLYTCSALKQSYRKLLRIDPNKVKFVYLKGPAELISERLANRKDHFFNPALLKSQFDDLEEPSDALEVDISPPPETIADSIIAALRLGPAKVCT
jgi:gluconokinase